MQGESTPGGNEAPRREYSDEELRLLVLESYYAQSAEATATLGRVMRDRVRAGVRPYLAAMMDRSEREELLDAVNDSMMLALGRIATPRLVESPWAYLTRVIELSARRASFRIRRRRVATRGVIEEVALIQASRNEPLSEIFAAEFEAIVADWQGGLTETEADVFRAIRLAVDLDISFREATRRLYPEDPKASNRLQKAKSRGLRADGFLWRLGQTLRSYRRGH